MKPESGTSTRRRRVPNRRGQGELLRDDIVRAAAELIAETGDTSAVTLSGVARRVGIAAPSIYPHFRNPEAILLVVVEQEFARLRDYLDDTVERAEDDPAARLRSLCTAYLGFAREHPQRYLVMFGGVWNATDAVADNAVDTADVAALGQTSLRRLATLLGACVETGLSTSADPDSDAIALWVALHGLAHQRIVSSHMTWPPDLEDRLIRRLAHLADHPGSGRDE